MFTEQDMTPDEMERSAREDRCSCGSRLTVAWGGALGIDGYVLRCAKDSNHKGITRHDKEYEKEIAMIKEARGMDSKSLMAMPEAKMVERVNLAKFPQDLNPEEKRLLAQVAITYGLDPLMGEVTIYQGRPWVSIDGRYRKAQETGRLDGVETRPANKQERVDWEIPTGDYFFRSEVYVKGASRPFVAWGRVFSSEIIGGKGFRPVEKNPQRMAEKRAEAQGLRKAFHIPLPSAEDIGSPEESGHISVTVDKTTGEITEQAFKPENSTHTTAQIEPVMPEKAEPPLPEKLAKGKAAPADPQVTDRPSLFKAAHDLYGMSPLACAGEGGYGKPEDITNPAEVWKQIKALRSAGQG